MIERSMCWVLGVSLATTAPALAWQGPPPTRVTLAQVETRTFPDTLAATAEVIPMRESQVSVEVLGSVAEVHVDEGYAVEPGQPLLQLKQKLKTIQKARAEAQLQAAEQQLAEYLAGSREEEVREAREAVVEAQVLVDLADDELERLEGLVQTDIVTQREHKAALAETLRTRALLRRREAVRDRIETGPRPEIIARAEAEVAVRQAEVALIEDALEKTTLKAPFAGVITEQFVEVGGYVREGDPAFALVQMDPVHVVAAVPETAIGRLEIDASVTVHLDARPDHPVSGQVGKIIPQADRLARTYPVLIRVPNPDHAILHGMTARVEFTTGAGEASLAVPRDALVRSSQGTVVYTVQESAAIPIPVEVVGGHEGWLAVRGSLQAGDAVIIRGNEGLRPGQTVQVLDENGDSE